MKIKPKTNTQCLMRYVTTLPLGNRFLKTGQGNQCRHGLNICRQYGELCSRQFDKAIGEQMGAFTERTRAECGFKKMAIRQHDL